jgi:hypothetical protein
MDTIPRPYFDRETPETYLVNSRYNRAYKAVNDYIDETGAQILAAASLGPIGSLGSGLRSASAGLQELFSGGSITGKSIIEVREILLRGGFTMQKARGAGYLFQSSLGEEVRIMHRGGGWDLRIMNRYRNYLDAAGNVATGRGPSHGITVFNR